MGGPGGHQTADINVTPLIDVLLVLLIICLVLGLGTFLAVMFGLVSSGSTTTTGFPEGVAAAGFLFAG